MDRSMLLLGAAFVAATTLAGGAAADGHRVQVTYVAAPPNAARMAPSRRAPVASAVTPLDAASLADAKQQIAEKFHRAVRTVSAGLPSPLTLTVQSWTNTIGAVSGEMEIFNGAEVGVCAAPSCYSYDSGIWLNTTGSVDLTYAGLTAGSIYLLDCGVAQLDTASVWMMTTETSASTTPTTPTSDHLLISFLSTMDTAWLNISGKAKAGAFNNIWQLASCTLHQVD